MTQIKLQVGVGLGDGIRWLRIAGAAVGDGIRIAVDAHECWNVGEGVDHRARRGSPWIDEPTSAGDILGGTYHARP
ncbi:enolase C-terminal domain-like protein [Streptomyces sp. NPDC052682]|uniref:enolase C-terminal domain-like protein n=1 Tax=Streptomyces sp. NPDC052682 TaxID=3154954 RepID=UPI00343CD3AB